MADQSESVISALLLNYLSKKDKNLADVFQKKTNSVSYLNYLLLKT